MQNRVISNFWLFIIASVVLVVSAIVLRDHKHCDLVLYFEGALSGARGVQEIIKYYLVGKSQPERLNT